MPTGVFFQCGEELRFAEIWPQRLGDNQFGVRNLPEQEIADAHFAAGANEQVWIGVVRRVEVLRKQMLVDFRRVEFALLYLVADAANGFNDFSAAAVAQGKDQRQAVVFREGCFGFLELRLDKFGQTINLTDRFQPNIVFVQLTNFVFQEPRQILHQSIDFVLRPIPIFHGKGVKRQIFDPGFTGRANNSANGFDAIAMAFNAWKMAGFGPATVPVHDDGDVRRRRRFGFFA